MHHKMLCTTICVLWSTVTEMPSGRAAALVTSEPPRKGEQGCLGQAQGHSGLHEPQQPVLTTDPVLWEGTFNQSRKG